MFSNLIEKKIKNLDPVAHKFLIDAIKRKCGNENANRVNPEPGDGISADTISEMFKKAMDALNNKYIEGGVAYIDKHHPEISRKLDDAEGKLNAKANAYYDGKIDLEEFRSELKHWYLLNLKAIEIHKNYLKEINSR